jgi:hypothetical protein
MLSSYLPYPRPLGAPQKTYGRSLTAALTRKGIPVASWLTLALDRTNWRQAINSVPAMPSTPTNHIGRTIEMGNGSCMQGIVTAISYLSDGPQWQVALDNGKTTYFPYNGLKRLLLPTDDRLLWASTALRVPSALLSMWVMKKYGTRWYLGWITNHDINASNSEILWQVLYQDGDTSDYNLAELADLLLPLSLALHLKNPKKLIGRAVEKVYDRVTHRGTITETSRQKKTKITLWRVAYEDSDTSDYNIAELAPLLKKKKKKIDQHENKKNVTQ